MNKNESKYFYTASLMNDALLELIEKKDYEYITVKEICQKAGVNRSTFYLHYENINDLLSETLKNSVKKFLDKFPDYKSFYAKTEKDDLLLFTREYTVPYLEYIKENKRLYVLANKHKDLFNVKNTTGKLFEYVFSPVLDKFNVPERDKKYIISFFVSGVHAMINVWIENDFKDSIDYMADLIYQYIKR